MLIVIFHYVFIAVLLLIVMIWLIGTFGIFFIKDPLCEEIDMREMDKLADEAEQEEKRRLGSGR